MLKTRESSAVRTWRGRGQWWAQQGHSSPMVGKRADNPPSWGLLGLRWNLFLQPDKPKTSPLLIPVAF